MATTNEVRRLSDAGNLVTTYVMKVTVSCGVFFTHNDYSQTMIAFLHISKITPRWVEIVKHILMQQQKFILIVIGVSEVRHEVGLSLRQSSVQGYNSRMAGIKNNEKAIAFIVLIKSKVNTRRSQQLIGEEEKRTLQKYDNCFYHAPEAFAIKKQCAIQDPKFTLEAKKLTVTKESKKIQPKRMNWSHLMEIPLKEPRDVKAMERIPASLNRSKDGADTSMISIDASGHNTAITAENFGIAEKPSCYNFGKMHTVIEMNHIIISTCLFEDSKKINPQGCHAS